MANQAAQMHEVCDRLPVPVAHAALARYFIERPPVVAAVLPYLIPAS
jgi:hypothetical protein